MNVLYRFVLHLPIYIAPTAELNSRWSKLYHLELLVFIRMQKIQSHTHAHLFHYLNPELSERKYDKFQGKYDSKNEPFGKFHNTHLQ